MGWEYEEESCSKQEAQENTGGLWQKAHWV